MSDFIRFLEKLTEENRTMATATKKQPAVVKPVIEEEEIDVNPPFDVADIDDEAVVTELQSDAVTRSLSAKLGRWYGGLYVEYAAAETVKLTSEVQQNGWYADVTAQLERRHLNFINDELPKLDKSLFTSDQRTSGAANGNASQPAQTTGGEGEAIQHYTAEYVEKAETQSGKPVFRIHTTSGKYAKFGVALFPADFKKFGVRDLINNKGQFTPHCNITIDESGKYPVVKTIGGAPKQRSNADLDAAFGDESDVEF